MHFSKQVALIFNPISGTNTFTGQTSLTEILKALKVEGIEPDVFETQKDVSPRILSTQLAQSQPPHKKYSLIIAVGGDGTISEVAKGLIHQTEHSALGIIPNGTFNNMARNLQIPTDFKSAIKRISSGREYLMDVGVANDTEFFFEVAGIGIDASLFPIADQIKDQGWWNPSGFWESIKKIYQFKPSRVLAKLDRPVAEAFDYTDLSPWRENKLRKKFQSYASSSLDQHDCYLHGFLIIAALGKHYGSAFQISPDALLDDGLLNIQVYRYYHKFELILHYLSMFGGKRMYLPRVKTLKVSEIEFSTPRLYRKLSCHVDGHSFGTLPLKLRILPKALKVII